jgi:UDP-GlcNAc3NAcA epimerase
MGKVKIIAIVGARPQIIKAAALSRAIKTNYQQVIRQVVIHSGQHYDDNMSQIFFEELDIPLPDYNLEAGSGSHAGQTAKIMRGTEEILVRENPDAVVVYGDTNTTLAGALAASKLKIPVAHIEAGLRSFNKSMPEEINRVVSDHLSSLLFSPTQTGYENLVREGFRANSLPPYSIDNPGIFHCGDVMLDNALYFIHAAEKRSKILSKLQLEGKDFVLCTIHRENNTDVSSRLNSIMKSVNDLSREKQMDFILPLHPRTSKMLPLMLAPDLHKSVADNPFLKIIGPVSYFDMLMLESRCRIVLTDSGGVQKESFFFRKPCLVLRPESEWKEIIETGTASIVDADEAAIRKYFDHYHDHPPEIFPEMFGDGKAAEFILDELVKFIGTGLQV